MKKVLFILSFFYVPLTVCVAQTYTLDMLLEAARANPTIKIAAIETQQAKASVQEAVGASLPKIDAGLYGQFEANPLKIDDMIPGFNENVNGIISAINYLGTGHLPPIATFDSPLPNHWSALFSAELTQPLFTWGKIAFSIKLSRIGLQAKQIQQLTIERELFTKTAIQTAQLYYLRNIETLAGEQQTTVERLKALADESLANKAILPVDAYAVAVTLLETTAAKEQISAQIDSALFALVDYTQLTDLQTAHIDFSFIPTDFSQLRWKDVEEAVSYVRNSSSESALLDLQTQIAQTQKTIAASDAWAKPDVGLKLAYNAATKPYNSTQSTFRWNFTAAVAINARIFEGGQSIARVKKAELESQKAIQEQAKVLSALEKKLRDLNASLAYMRSYHTVYTQKLLQMDQQLAIRKNELHEGYIEERVYLEEYLQYLAIQIQQQQNNASFFADYCLYSYICGKFPIEYLKIEE